MADFYKNLSIKELYEMAVERNIEDYKIEVQFRDDGGDYCGKDEEVYFIIDDENKTVTL